MSSTGRLAELAVSGALQSSSVVSETANQLINSANLENSNNIMDDFLKTILIYFY
jgi:hypothetical protein